MTIKEIEKNIKEFLSLCQKKYNGIFFHIKLKLKNCIVVKNEKNFISKQLNNIRLKNLENKVWKILQAKFYGILFCNSFFSGDTNQIEFLFGIQNLFNNTKNIINGIHFYLKKDWSNENQITLLTNFFLQTNIWRQWLLFLQKHQKSNFTKKLTCITIPYTIFDRRLKRKENKIFNKIKKILVKKNILRKKSAWDYCDSNFVWYWNDALLSFKREKKFPPIVHLRNKEKEHLNSIIKMKKQSSDPTLKLTKQEKKYLEENKKIDCFWFLVLIEKEEHYKEILAKENRYKNFIKEYPNDFNLSTKERYNFIKAYNIFLIILSESYQYIENNYIYQREDSRDVENGNIFVGDLTNESFYNQYCKYITEKLLKTSQKSYVIHFFDLLDLKTSIQQFKNWIREIKYIKFIKWFLWYNNLTQNCGPNKSYYRRLWG